MSTFLSERLAAKLRSDGVDLQTVDRLDSTDFSGGRSVHDASWARHNERIHAAIVMVAERRGFDAALALAQTDWRDVVVDAGLADQDWGPRLDEWFADD